MIAPESTFHNPEEDRLSSMKIAGLFFFFVAFQYVFRFPYFWSFGFVNEDAALIRFASKTVSEKGLWYWFVHSYGPGVLRPFQLLSLAANELLFQGQAIYFHAVSLLWLALAQTLFVVALRPLTGMLPAVLAVLVAGTAQMSSEPLFWISDQHDIFLFVFFSCMLLFLRCIVSSTEERVWHFYVFFFLTCWGCFLSNEKGVVVPVLASIFSLLVAPRFFLKISAVGAVAVLSYFSYRYALLGVFIGGYDSGLFSREITWPVLGKLILTVLFTPFRQNSSYWSVVSGISCLTALGIVFTLYAMRSTVRSKYYLALAGFFLSMTVASLPVYSYLLPFDSYSVFSTRLHWLILLAWLPFLSILFSKVFQSVDTSKCIRGFSSVLVIAVVLAIAAGGRASVRRFARASQFSRDALELYLQNCSCANPSRPQTSGLPQHFAEVNVYTEAVWIEEEALYRGAKMCEKDQNGCRLRYRQGRKGQLHVRSIAD